MRIFTKTLTALTAAAIITAGAAAPALANSDNGRIYKSVTISYADLNLASEEGADRLESRIRSAARKVCGPPENRSVRAMSDYRQCYKTAFNGGKKAMVTLVAQAESGIEFANNARLPIGQ
jgi:UrcA family protein